jgi:hypothetical protein
MCLIKETERLSALFGATTRIFETDFGVLVHLKISLHLQTSSNDLVASNSTSCPWWQERAQTIQMYSLK